MSSILQAWVACTACTIAASLSSSPNPGFVSDFASIVDYMNHSVHYAVTPSSQVVRLKFNDHQPILLSVPVLQAYMVYANLEIPFLRYDHGNASYTPVSHNDGRGMDVKVNWYAGQLNTSGDAIGFGLHQLSMLMQESLPSIPEIVNLSAQTRVNVRCDPTGSERHYPSFTAGAMQAVADGHGLQLQVDLASHHRCYCADADLVMCKNMYLDPAVNSDTITQWTHQISNHIYETLTCNEGFTIDAIFNPALAIVACFWALDVVMEIILYRRKQHRLTGHSWRYLLFGGVLDILTPPGQLLWAKDHPYYTTASICMVATLLATNTFLTGVSWPQALQLQLLPFTINIARKYRYRLLGSLVGCGFSIYLCAAMGRYLHCATKFGLDFQWLVSLIPMLCAMLITWSFLRRLYLEYQALVDPKLRITTQQRRFKFLDRRAYVKRLFANEHHDAISVDRDRTVKDTRTRRQKLNCFFRGCRRDKNYNLSPRVFSATIFGLAVAIALCFIYSTLIAALAATLEHGMTGGNCCRGVPCDPVPDRMAWAPDMFNLGIGMGIGDPHRCRKLWATLRNILQPAVGACGVLATVFTFVSSCYFLAGHRDNMIRMYRGQRPSGWTRPNASDAISSTIMFAGTQIAAIIISWVQLTLVLTAVVTFIVVSTVLVAANVLEDWFWKPFVVNQLLYNKDDQTLGTLPVVILNYVVLYALVMFIFSLSRQSHGVNRQGVFYILDMLQYLVYIFNALYSVLKRYAIGLASMAIFLGRMDLPLTHGWLAKYDSIYKLYFHHCYFELYHSHPVFMTALYFFLMRQTPTFVSHTSDFVSDDGKVEVALPTISCEEFRIRNRWQLAVTLINNRSLRDLRAHAILSQQQAEEASVPTQANDKDGLHQPLLIPSKESPV
eukprot:TRINITY_DN10828_c0_g1_i4.p1 TRINITY_DN10828_c0_g1~~TRINITY_DN10828_c0_g1_i4.p1  ORF type:complete len:895 (+),score=112.86 TRINITY_DN10828_c0_g1_i4:145-2829(+)